MTQRSLFDILDSNLAKAIGRDTAKADAIDRAESGAGKTWNDTADQAIRAVAEHLETFTTDDVWELVESPPEPRAMGAAMRRAAGVVAEKTDRVRFSTQGTNHSRPVAIWRSLIYHG